MITIHCDTAVTLNTQVDVDNTLSALNEAAYITTFVHELSHYMLSVSTSAGLSEYIKLYNLANLSGSILTFLTDNASSLGQSNPTPPLIETLRRVSTITSSKSVRDKAKQLESVHDDLLTALMARRGFVRRPPSHDRLPIRALQYRPLSITLRNSEFYVPRVEAVAAVSMTSTNDVGDEAEFVL